MCRVNGEAERFEGVGVLQLHQLFPTVVATTQLPLDPLQQASSMQALMGLRGEAEGNPNEGCAWTGDLHGVWQLHQQQPFQALAELWLSRPGVISVRLGLSEARWPCICSVAGL